MSALSIIKKKKVLSNMRRYGYKALFGVVIEVLLGAQFALATKKVITIGMLGIGKSTVGNCIVDLTENSFLALD